jgi:hypothetical protein
VTGAGTAERQATQSPGHILTVFGLHRMSLSLWHCGISEVSECLTDDRCVILALSGWPHRGGSTWSHCKNSPCMGIRRRSLPDYLWSALLKP